jgi:hypothetical protein
MRRLLLSVLVVGAVVLVAPSIAHAQAAIAGTVKDSTGAALPGVTVEASSPALIERVRTAVTDGAGQYRINDLSPGTYDVTFTVSGFQPVKRTGVVLLTNFTAPVNVELAIGNLDETITVTGATPVVDVANNRTTVVVDRDMLDAIPTPTRSLQARAYLIPGTMVTPVGSGQTSMTIFGSQAADQVVMVDGMRLNLLEGQGQFSGIYLNDGMAQEISYDTGAQNAEVAQGGLRVNMIPREGGNNFSGIFFIQGANGPLASDNRSDAVKSFIPLPLGLAYTYEINPSFGGPIKKDKAWFYFTYKLQDTKSYTTLPDRSQGTQQNWPNYSYVTRVTWQVTPRDKIRVYVDKQMNGQKFEGLGATTTIEASHRLWTPRGMTPQVKWMQARTNRLMLEAGITMYDLNFRREPQEGVSGELPRFETTTGVNSGTYAGTMDSWTQNYTSMASASYVTGSHSIKGGINYGWGRRVRTWPSPNRADILQLRFTNGQPAQVQVRNTPIDESIERMNADLGLFLQDAWTMDKLTLNVGGRFDYFNAEVPALSAPASTWVPARERSATTNVPNWKDFAIRLAASYDLFGNGKTALKVNASKYVASAALGFAEGFNTLTASTETRTWQDLDGNRSVLDASGNLQRNEIVGGTANFGAASSTDRVDEALKREYNWEYSATVQHELFPRVAVTGGYHRRTYGNLAITDNLNVGIEDWTPFTITAPADDRLPGGGNFPITLYTLNTTKVGVATDNVRTFSTKNARVYNGFDVNVQARIRSSGMLLGGVTHERTASTNCDQRDNPNSLRFCDSVGPFRTLFKMSGAYELPYRIQVAGTFVARPGISISSNYVVTSALAGRTIVSSTAGAAQITVNLVEPGTMFTDYLNTLDMRVSRTFRFGKYRLQGLVDIYNLFNGGTVTTVNTNFAATPATRVWMNPQTIQTSRYVRFGAQLDF